MGRELTEYEQEFYNITPVVEVPEVVETPVAEVVIETPEIEVVAEIPTPVIEPVVEASIEAAPYKAKKFIEVADEKELYNTLNKKYQYEGMSAEQKAMAFIAKQNPELDENELLFIAATKYGIGIDAPGDDELTDEQKIKLREQGIDRKKLISQADKFFQDEAAQVALPDYDPLELDPDYKSYREQVAAQNAAATEQAQKITEINTSIETNAKAISEITETVEIDIDEGKLAIPVNFKINKDRQEQLADFAKRYQPTQAEYDAFNDTLTGKFDYKGYLASLAPVCFSKEIAKAGMRQALTQDRANFIEKELKNSTLRNNDVSKQVETKFDIIDHWKFG